MLTALVQCRVCSNTRKAGFSGGTRWREEFLALAGLSRWQTLDLPLVIPLESGQQISIDVGSRRISDPVATDLR